MSFSGLEIVKQDARRRAVVEEVLRARIEELEAAARAEVSAVMAEIAGLVRLAQPDGAVKKHYPYELVRREQVVNSVVRIRAALDALTVVVRATHRRGEG